MLAHELFQIFLWIIKLHYLYAINHTRFVETVVGATDKKIQCSYFTLFRVSINWARIL